jgi:hypothetical protein
MRGGMRGDMRGGMRGAMRGGNWGRGREMGATIRGRPNQSLVQNLPRP